MPLTINPSGQTITQHDVLVGAASNLITSVAPSATSGVPLISQGAAADPAFGTAVVAGGGTGAVTLTGVLTGNGTSAITANTVTQHGVLLGGATNAVSSLGVAATGTVLTGVTGADPAFSATPSVTSITFGAGSALSTFTDWLTFTPTVTGNTTAGTTTYVAQNGFYSRIGNIVFITFDVTISAATGTGNVVVGGLPFTVSNTGGYTPITSAYFSSNLFAMPVGTTTALIDAQINTTKCFILCYGNGVSGSFAQMQNQALEISGTFFYRV